MSRMSTWSTVPPPKLLLLLLSVAAVVASDSEVVIGDLRVQALSATLLRVEPKGPHGFEDRTTFSVTDRSFPGVPLTQHNDTWLSTDSLNIHVTPPPGLCDAPLGGSDASAPVRSAKFPDGATASSPEQCCGFCTSDVSCTAWVLASSSDGNNCWPLASYGSVRSASGRTLGGTIRGVHVRVYSKDDTKVLYDSSASTPAQPNLLHWPSPLTSSAYAIQDSPRFFVPEWGPAPIPKNATVDPALRNTNGYDFRNNVAGDTYVFVLGEGLEGWRSARAEFVKLMGACPVLPDFAYGTWFTWWHSYTETEAKSDISLWEAKKLPIDIWALDMNWRNTSNNQDHYYDHPNTNLFPDFSEWFEYLKGQKLRTYFNDHPFPVASRNAGGLQTSREEVAFRWTGLTKWLAKGLTYWWFDHNWGFSIPPPFVNTSHTSGNWEGLDNAAWGSHIYFKTVEWFDKTVRDPAADAWYGGKAMTLTKFGIPDWRPGMDAALHAESPAQHRFPVWWTGDGVNLQASVETMVDSGVHDFKPFVHSDCGGDYRPKEGGDLLRWTAHCVFGTILRFHGNDHRPWTYGQATEDVIQSYLTTRYSLMPSLISAGHQSSLTAHPLVARCDLFWPEIKESFTNQQYIWLNSTLVAPIWDSSKNDTSRSVWVPPGDWQDAWDGTIVTGPKTITTTQPYERIPMWHSRNSAVVVTTDRPMLRVDDQDWSHLVLQVFPSQHAGLTGRHVLVEQAHTEQSTVLSLNTTGEVVTLMIDPSEGTSVTRSWTVRVHLLPGQRVATAMLDGSSTNGIKHIQADPVAASHFPFGGTGSAPVAGSVAEIVVAAATHQRELVMTMARSL